MPRGSAQTVNGGLASYYPFGEDKSTNQSGDAWRFGTYWRDSISDLDYPDQRFYSSSLGRFMAPDPSGSGGANRGDPRSWNRYSYAINDPANANDPSGLGPFGPPTLAVGTDPSTLDPFAYSEIPVNTDSGLGSLPDFTLIWGVFAYVGAAAAGSSGNSTPQPTITTQCALSLWATPILIPGTSIPIPFEYHTALVITKATFANGVATASVTNWLEAYGQGIGSSGYLNSPGLEPVPGNGKPSLWTSFRNYGFDSGLCNQYTKAFNWATNNANSQNDKILYNNFGAPNSNSWVWTLLKSIGLSIPSPPWQSPGWGVPLP